MKADGSDKKKVFNSLINDGRGLWFSTSCSRRSALPATTSPWSATAATASDDGVALHVINSKSGRMRQVGTSSELRADLLGHNDPDFNRDGTQDRLHLQRQRRHRRQPQDRHLHLSDQDQLLAAARPSTSSPGYANPSWSPDGKLLAVETTDGNGRDIAIITVARGDERVQLTRRRQQLRPGVLAGWRPDRLSAPRRSRHRPARDDPRDRRARQDHAGRRPGRHQRRRASMASPARPGTSPGPSGPTREASVDADGRRADRPS